MADPRLPFRYSSRKRMHTWIFSHDGVYLGGYSVVKAPDEDQARARLGDVLKAANLINRKACSSNDPPTLVWCSLTGGSQVIWDGDY